MNTVRKRTVTTLAVVAAVACLLVAYLTLHQGPTASQDQDSRQEADTTDDAREVVTGPGEGEPAVDEQTESPSPDLSFAETDTEDLQLEGELDLTTEEGQRRLRMARYEALEVQLIAEQTRMYLTLPSYHSVKEQLIEKLRAKYADAVSNGIATVLEDAGTLGKTFWENGDYRKLSNLDLMYEARALLELALEIEPNSEQALRQLCEVIQTGWPIVVPEADQKGTQPVMMLEHQRRYDLFIATWRLWEEHLSKRPASSPQDIAYAYDLIGWTWPRHEIDDREAFMASFNARNPNPSPELTAYMENGIPLEKRLAVARWALAGARQPESPISEWTGILEQTVPALESGSKGSIHHVMRLFYWDEVNPSDNLRYKWGRTFSFHGPQELRHRNPILNQELYERNLNKQQRFLPKPGASAQPKP